MARIRKWFIIAFVVIVSGLFLVSGGYMVWSMASIHNRPWLLETGLRFQLAECRTGPGLIAFLEDWENLTVKAQEAESCLDATERKVWFRRDYSQCISKIISTEMEARLLRLKMDQREQDQRKILDSLLPSLTLAFSGGEGNRKSWSQFNLNGIEITRARNLLKEAEIFYGQDEIELSFNTALRAWISWDRFSRKNDTSFARFSNSALRNEWNKQVRRRLEWSKSKGQRAIIVDKFNHLCLLIDRGRVRKRYSADLGRKWFQRKSRAQDASTPEGEYVITKMIPRGKYGHALLINYPNTEDKARFQSLKREGILPAGARIGGNIEIHGKGGKESDWTDGCISLNDNDMLELYRVSYNGMPVTIVGISNLAAKKRD